MEKVFDKIQLKHILKILEDRGTRIERELEEAIPVSQGIRQGDPFLFNLVNEIIKDQKKFQVLFIGR